MNECIKRKAKNPHRPCFNYGCFFASIGFCVFCFLIPDFYRRSGKHPSTSIPVSIRDEEASINRYTSTNIHQHIEFKMSLLRRFSDEPIVAKVAAISGGAAWRIVGEKKMELKSARLNLIMWKKDMPSIVSRRIRWNMGWPTLDLGLQETVSKITSIVTIQLMFESILVKESPFTRNQPD